jgi:hypothetical protein
MDMDMDVDIPPCRVRSASRRRLRVMRDIIATCERLKWSAG